MDKQGRIILISDIYNESGSIIPWGLNLAKQTGSDLDILHIIDPRENHGVESPVSDSQSITPGEKLTHEEILKREKAKAERALGKLLSKEVSRFNYSLKVETIIVTEYMEEGLKKIFKERHGSLLITSSELEDTVFTDSDELLSIVRDLNEPVFIVPPGSHFQKPEKVFMLADFSKSPGLELRSVFKWLTPFKPLVSAGEVAKKMDMIVKLELTSKTWEKGVKKLIDPNITLKTNQLKGRASVGAVENYVTRNKFDWVIIPKSKKDSTKKLFPVDISKKLVKSIDKPLLLY